MPTGQRVWGGDDPGAAGGTLGVWTTKTGAVPPREEPGRSFEVEVGRSEVSKPLPQAASP